MKEGEEMNIQDIIIDELNERIRDARNLDNMEAATTLESFLDWFKEHYIKEEN